MADVRLEQGAFQFTFLQENHKPSDFNGLRKV